MERDTSKRNSFISNFKGTRLFIAKLLVGVMLLAFYINSLLPQYEQRYTASLIDKVKRLESIIEPKIVLLGNSNLAFGIDSELLEAEMGMPVVNMGLHGGLGNAFHEEMAKMNVTPGDIYIICHTSYNDNDRIESTELAWITIENHFDFWNLLRFCDIKAMVQSFPVYLKKSFTLASTGMGNMKSNTIYSRQAFNKYGDIEVERIGSVYNGEGNKMRRVPGVGDVAADRINALNKYLTANGATLLVAGYPIRNGSVTANSSQYMLFQEKLSEKLVCPVISNYIDYMFDYRYFYNDHLHLNSEGAKLRTMQLVLDLKQWMQSSSSTNKNKEQYLDIVSDVDLPHIDDFNEYINALSDAKDRYSIFITWTKGEAMSKNEPLLDMLKKLGLDANGFSTGNYAAVLENGIVIQESAQYGKVELSGEVDAGKMKYSILSDGGKNKKQESSIRLNGYECSENVEGLNIVVYSNETHRRLDEVGFDCFVPEIKVHRYIIKPK